MANQAKKKILLIVDGSDRSLETVRYVGQQKAFRKMQVVLFNVFSGVPDSYWDLEKEPKSVKAVVHVRAWEAERKKEMQEFMEKAQQILSTSGFSKAAVTMKIHKRRKGIARDIIREARDGYSAVVLRRRGKSKLPEFLVGSVAVKLIDKLSFVPVLIAGRKPVGNNLLVAMDGSEGAMRAVDFVGMMLDGFDFKINLFHVIRGNRNTQSGFQNLLFSQKDMENEEKAIINVFDEAKRRLISSGFKPDDIMSKITTDVDSRAGAIVQEAKQVRCETIVLGRRGLSKAQEFFIGRVSNKVVHLARDNAVWVVA